MSLLYKPDWEETKERYRAWWAHEYFGRCGLWVTAPRADTPGGEPPEMPQTPLERWTNLEYLVRANEYGFRRTFFGGEAFPTWSGGYPGHTAIPTFLGCRIELDLHTGWWEPVFRGRNWSVRERIIDRQGFWWQFTLKLLRRAATESQGKAIPSIGAFGGAGDTLAALRGTNELLYDLHDCPERVREAEDYLMDMWIEVYGTFYDIVSTAAEGSTCWFRLWAPGKFYAAQCDFSYMISPAMFEKLFLPAIEKQTEFLDYAVYHLDGIEAFRHVPLLCQLPRLQAIQILPGAGKPSPLHYMDVLKQVQKAGKNLHITIPADEVSHALENLSARGLFIATDCRTEEEARTLVKNCEKWSKDRG